jgi:hypothetical protein
MVGRSSAFVFDPTEGQTHHPAFFVFAAKARWQAM